MRVSQHRGAVLSACLPIAVAISGLQSTARSARNAGHYQHRRLLQRKPLPSAGRYWSLSGAATTVIRRRRSDLADPSPI